MYARIPVVLAILLLFLLAGATNSDAAPSTADRANEVTLAQSPSERARSVSGVAPVLTAPAPMSLPQGTTADQYLYATDGDGDPITFSKSFGPAFMTVTTIDPGRGSATGNVHLAPSFADQGVVNGGISVSDGIFAYAAMLEITVTGPDRPPVLAQPSPMSGRAGQTLDQELTATDPDGDLLSFVKVSGPAYMLVQTIEAAGSGAMGVVHLATTTRDSGSTTATVGASDGQLMDQRSFSITIRANTAPQIEPIDTLFVTPGSTVDRSVFASDVEGDSIILSKAFGPAWMTVSTVSRGLGFASGNIHLTVSPENWKGHRAAVAASDGVLQAQSWFTIVVHPIPNSAPILSQPADMTVLLGEVVEQKVTATDPDGDRVSITKVSGPEYVTVSHFPYRATAIIQASPGAGDLGSATATIRATDDWEGLADTKSFTVNVLAGDFPPPCGASAFIPLTTTFTFRDLTPPFQSTMEVQTADLNGDGVLDLVAEFAEPGQVIAALGAGDGTFGESTDLIAERWPASGAIADFNRDGILDVAISNYMSNNVSVFLGDGTGGFGPKQNFRVGASAPNSIAAVDVNRDGKIDLVTANGQYGVLYGVGDGSFVLTYTSHDDPSFPGSDLAAPDLNGDGAPDLVVVHPEEYYSEPKITVFLNNGSGGYGSGTDYAVGAYPRAVAAADLNEDGKVDIAVTSARSNYVSVFLGVGNGTLGPRRNFTTRAGPSQIAILDVNGDNHLDLAITNLATNLESSSVSVLLGDGSGAFGSRTDVPAGGAPYGIVSGDFDGDLRSDLAVANSTGSVTTLLNHCAPPRDHPPVVTAPKVVSGAEGSEITFSISANDPDGPAISSLTADFSGLPVGNKATCTPGSSDTGGVFRWTPGFDDSRPTSYFVTFTAANVLSASATTKITVTAASVVTVCQARAFTTDGKGGIRLGGGKEHRCVNLEPVGGSFRLGTVDVTSIVMKSHNTGSVEEIGASEVAAGGDRDGNGVQ